jgi:hypothetical protein
MIRSKETLVIVLASYNVSREGGWYVKTMLTALIMILFILPFSSCGEKEEQEIYIFVRFPEELGIGAVEYRIDLPEGVRIWSDRFYEKRSLTMGSFEHGMTEGFDCVYGPELLLHVLTLGIEKDLENATISIMPSHRTDFIGIAECDDAFSEHRATSFKAVINPID